MFFGCNLVILLFNWGIKVFAVNNKFLFAKIIFILNLTWLLTQIQLDLFNSDHYFWRLLLWHVFIIHCSSPFINKWTVLLIQIFYILDKRDVYSSIIFVYIFEIYLHLSWSPIVKRTWTHFHLFFVILYCETNRIDFASLALLLLI